MAFNSECCKYILLLLIFISNPLAALERQNYDFCPANVKHAQLYSLLERTLNLTLKPVSVLPSVTGGSLMTGKITNVSPLCCYMCHSVTLRQFSSWNDCIEQSRITYVVRLMSQPCWMRTLLLIHDAINPFLKKKMPDFLCSF